MLNALHAEYSTSLEFHQDSLSSFLCKTLFWGQQNYNVYTCSHGEKTILGLKNDTQCFRAITQSYFKTSIPNPELCVHKVGRTKVWSLTHTHTHPCTHTHAHRCSLRSLDRYYRPKKSLPSPHQPKKELLESGKEAQTRKRNAAKLLTLHL